MRAPLFFPLAVIAAIAAEPASIEARKARARALLEREDFNAALEEARAVNRDMPDDVSAYQLMAAAQLGLGDYNEAEKQLQWMLDLRIGKADFEGWLVVAHFREVTGDLEGALEALNLANGRLAGSQETERRSLLAYAAQLYYGLGKLDLAKPAADAAAAGPDAGPRACQVLARILLAQGKRAEAIRILRNSTARDRDPRALYLLAEISREAPDFAAFEGAALEASGSRSANRELILYYAGRGRRAGRALEIARRESSRRHDIFTLDALAMALFANHQIGEARQTIERVLAAGTRDAEILRHARRIGVRAP